MWQMSRHMHYLSALHPLFRVFERYTHWMHTHMHMYIQLMVHNTTGGTDTTNAEQNCVKSAMSHLKSLLSFHVIPCLHSHVFMRIFLFFPFCGAHASLFRLLPTPLVFCIYLIHKQWTSTLSTHTHTRTHARTLCFYTTSRKVHHSLLDIEWELNAMFTSQHVAPPPLTTHDNAKYLFTQLHRYIRNKHSIHAFRISTHMETVTTYHLPPPFQWLIQACAKEISATVLYVLCPI
jgi:hypothetical protein